MKNLPLLLLLAASIAVPVNAETPPVRDLGSDIWAATDALGRILPLGMSPSGGTKPRFVGIFYFIWQGGHGTPGPYDLTRLLAENPDNPAYGPVSAFHWWGEPEAGYFRAADPWVIRRNMALLQNAGVDTLLIDVTNAFTYPETVKVLCETLRALRAEGNPTPQIAFVTHAHTADTVTRLWNELYKTGAYSELWSRSQGKSLLLADRAAKFDNGDPLPPEIREFFTFRDSWAWAPGQNKWPWLETFPQKGGWTTDPDAREEVPVAVAGHPTSNIGRSFQGGAQPVPDIRALTPTANRGLHFAEQWERAIALDPPFVFVTGWNEWVAQRFVVKPGQKISLAGKPVPEGGTFFVDTFSGEYNRDVEPSRAEGDTLYYQLVANVRRYKGARSVPLSGPAKTIALNHWEGWDSVTPEYRDTVGDTLHRDADGWGTLHYTDTTGRNDIVRAKVAYDTQFVTFFVETAAPLTPRTDKNWMQLFVDTDRSGKTGWHGYEVAVNLAPPVSDSLASLSRYAGEWKTVGRVAYSVRGNRLAVQIPRVFFPKGRRLTFDFHWSDNADTAKDEIQAFFLHGDSAPDRRFNYRFDTGP